MGLGLARRSVEIGLGTGIAPTAWVWRGDRRREHYPGHLEVVTHIQQVVQRDKMFKNFTNKRG
ncbi:hypothetical protein PROH_07695 [Prochlorothrix hollandica PCC 9006 = CALU 1027]|uniref:Uncharacterized protein n=1 Tax=Prochlorothrix hollandica PCC 9006 = CALU 1027 TaxID=317619 RepID=A0A0M2PYJ0_PROHO|nr:hypothetical protein PROH_07695 [Prochlorothrix hollandica PCC 9006 = CALU 1027]